jgi:hypothetical protein
MPTSPLPSPLDDASAPFLPISRGRCFVDLILRDPDWAWIPWELTAEGVEAGLRALGVFSADSRLLLRFYNVPRLTSPAAPATSASSSSSAPFTEELELTDWIGARYLLLGRPDTFHAAAVGLCDPTGRFHSLARSPWVRAPRSRSASPNPSPRLITTARTLQPDGTARLTTTLLAP